MNSPMGRVGPPASLGQTNLAKVATGKARGAGLGEVERRRAAVEQKSLVAGQRKPRTQFASVGGQWARSVRLKTDTL